MTDPARLTYYGGILFGSLLMIAVVVVYLVNGKLEIGGIVLTLVGFSLFGLSVWKTLDLNLKQGRVRVELRVFEQRNSPSTGFPPNLGVSIVSPLRYRVAIHNESTTTDDEEIEPVVAALQKQITEHISPIWGVSAELIFVPKGGKAPPDAWALVILDHSDVLGTLGYRDLSANGLPIGKVFAADAKERRVHWSVTASHELINMLINPRINLTVFVGFGASDRRLYAYDIVSPCNAEENAYTIDGISVSDFVYPSWFEPGAKAEVTRFDYRKRIKKPLEVRRGGYVTVYDIKGGEWRQIFGT